MIRKQICKFVSFAASKNYKYLYLHIVIYFTLIDGELEIGAVRLECLEISLTPP